MRRRKNVRLAIKNVNLLIPHATFLIAEIPVRIRDFKHTIGEDVMSQKKYQVRAECPQCACGDVSFLGPEKLREKFIGDENEIDILCPLCGTKHKGKVEVEEE